MKHKGFTIIEIIIVVVVVAILFTIGIVSYSFLRNDGMDVKIRGAVKTVGSALELYRTNNNLPAEQGYLHRANSLDGVLIPDYLQRDYRKGIKSRNATSEDTVLRWYKCGDKVVIYASLNDPTNEDKQAFTAARTQCRHSDAHAPSSGSLHYNYAQVF